MFYSHCCCNFILYKVYKEQTAYSNLLHLIFSRRRVIKRQQTNFLKSKIENIFFFISLVDDGDPWKQYKILLKKRKSIDMCTVIVRQKGIESSFKFTLCCSFPAYHPSCFTQVALLFIALSPIRRRFPNCRRRTKISPLFVMFSRVKNVCFVSVPPHHPECILSKQKKKKSQKENGIHFFLLHVDVMMYHDMIPAGNVFAHKLIFFFCF